MALDAGFTNFLTGFNNKNVGNVTSYTVTPPVAGYNLLLPDKGLQREWNKCQQ